jgi:Leucine-rich repeat (LRR) protein
MNLHTSCQEQTKYDGEVKVEYTPWHINLIRPIIDPERIHKMDLDEMRFISLPEEMQNMRNLRKLYLTDFKVKDWKKSADVINSLSNLNELVINYNTFEELPFNPSNLPNLEELYINYSKGFSLKEEINKISQLNSLDVLGISGININTIPDEFLTLKNLKRVQIGEYKQFNYNQGLEQLSKLPRLERLDLIYANLRTFPDNIEKLNKLRKLNLYHSQIDLEKAFSVISQWENLVLLNLGEMDIDVLPENVTELKSLQTLKLHNNRNLDHQKLFQQLAELPNLEELVISKTILHQQHDRFVMPKELAELKNLKRLDMATSQQIVFDSLFAVLTKLPKLEYLSLKHVYPFFKMEDENFGIPANIEQMSNLKELDLERSFNSIFNEIEKLPELEKLNWANSGTGEIPEVILKTTSLKSLNLNSCELKELPEEIGNLTNLVHLDLGNNQLKDLPGSITKLKKLRYLNLMGTHISESKEKRQEIEQMLPNTLVFFGEYEAYEPL